VGRNLHYLFASGFHHLTGIEISEDAVKAGGRIYPDMQECVKIINAPAEDALPRLLDNSYDVVFTMAVLQHIHPDSEAVFAEIARAARRHLVTVENEVSTTWRHFPRNYQGVFCRLGLAQVHEAERLPGLPASYVARVFVKGGLCS